jgi:CHAT domain-containing protein
MSQDRFQRISPCVFVILCGVLVLGTHNAFCSFVFGDASQVSHAVPAPVGQQTIRPPKAGEWVEVDAAERGPHLYSFELKAGEATEIEVRTKPGLAVSVWGPGNEKFSAPSAQLPSEVTDVYSSSTAFDRLSTPLIVVADISGRYHLRVTVNGIGKYSVRYLQPRQGTERDRKYMEAARLLFEIGAAGPRRSFESVRSHLERRLGLYEELADDISVADALYRHAAVFSSLGDVRRAIADRERASGIYLKMGMHAHALSMLPCGAYEGLGDFQSSLACYDKQLELSRSLSPVDHAGVLHNIGTTYHRMADEERARQYYDLSLAIKQRITPQTSEIKAQQIITYVNFGNLERGMNGGEVPIEFFPQRSREDFERALVPLFKALELARETNSTWDGFILRQIGNTYRALGRFAEAITYLQQSEATRTKQNDRQGVALARIDLGRAYIAKGDAERGAKLIEDTLTDLGPSGYPVDHVAAEFSKAGRPERARQLFSQALEIATKIGAAPRKANILFGLATMERDLGNFDTARRHIVEAIDVADGLRNRITDDTIRSVYFSAVKKYYDFYIDLLMQAHKAQPEKQYDRLAYEMSERARSRNLVDLLKISGVDIRQGVDAALLDREKELRKAFAEKAAYETRLLLGRPTQEQIAKARKDVADASDALNKVEAEIRKASPSYAAVTQPSNLTLKEVQAMLDAGTVMLAYSLGESKSYLWAISSDSLQSFDLPARRDVDTQARTFHEAVSSSDPKKAMSVPTSAAKLSDMLISPAAQVIRNKRVVVVADGSLNYVSFAALPVPGNASVPLAQSHEIAVLPSASALAVLRNDRSKLPAVRTLAVFADPVFAAADSRASQVRKLTPKSTPSNDTLAVVRDLDLALAGTGLGNGLPRLPFSRREADAIIEAAPAGSGIRKVDFQATKDAVFNSGLDQYRIVHFATHGLMDSRNPALSGLVLSLVDKQGNDVDGFLRLQDIYNLKLNADLVVLSACNTALGKEVRGEGIVGLTRGFMYAGSPRVVASLWKVDDAATAHFMSIFYRKMLTDNMRPAAALRAAQIEMMKQPRWRSPYYWAPFVLQGEWK